MRPVSLGLLSIATTTSAAGLLTLLLALSPAAAFRARIVMQQQPPPQQPQAPQRALQSRAQLLQGLGGAAAFVLLGSVGKAGAAVPTMQVVVTWINSERHRKGQASIIGSTQSNRGRKDLTHGPTVHIQP